MEAPINPRIDLRIATPRDIPALAHLIETSVRAYGPPHYTAEQVESSVEHLFGVDTTMIGDGTYYVAEMGGMIVGCGGWSARKTPYGGDQHEDVRNAETRDPATDPAVLRAFFVHPDYGRRGVGRALVEASEAAARAAGFTSYTLVSTLPGLPLYRALGYREIEPVEIPLPDGVTVEAVEMLKP